MVAKNVLKKLAFPLLSLRYKKSKISVEAAKNYLTKYSPKPVGTVYACNRMKIKYDLMIVVPAYNVEKYLRQCIDSVISQKTKYTYELIIIDDGSTDQTGAIADMYSKYDFVRVIHQCNRGLSGARNRALEVITGRYITFLDSDDYLMDGAINTWLDAAYKSQADIVEGAYTQFGDNLKEVNKIHEKEGLLSKIETVQYITGFAWGKVYKASLFERFKFPDGYWFEDTIINMILFWKVKSSYSMNKSVYAYRQNNSGITRTSRGKAKSLDIFWITEYCIQQLKNEGLLNEDVRGQVLRRFHMNYIQTKQLDKEIQEMIFVLTVDLYREFFAAESEISGLSFREKVLDRALRTENISLYKSVMICWGGI